VSILQRLTPYNLLEEKHKFLEDQTYNPFFHYDDPVDDDVFTRYGVPKPHLVELAEEIVKKTFFARNEQDILMNQGQIITHSEVTKRTEAFLEMHNLDSIYKIVWSASFVSRATINADTIKLRSTAEFRQQNLLGMLYHEIGTHALRRYNYQQQPWFKKKKKNGFSGYLKTEEGLASLHSMLPMQFKSAYSTALRYLAVNYARDHSLVELWHYLSEYIQDIETRWMVTFRQKRGITDSTKGGGFTKDLVYFEGMLEIYNWLKQNDFDLAKLYIGKIAHQDVELAKSLSPNFKPVLPSFYTLNKTEYRKKIIEIGQANSFDQMAVIS
jgi:hypothetical protein